MNNIIAFKDRKSTDTLNKKLLEMLRQSPEYDVELIAANKKSVHAHRVVLAMYSKYFRSILSQSDPGSKLIVPLPEYAYIVLEKLIELFYCGEIRAISAYKGQIMKALYGLEVISFSLPPLPPVTKPKKTFDMTDPTLITQKDGTSAKLLQSKQNPGPQQQECDSLHPLIQHSSDSVCNDNCSPTKEDKTDENALVEPNSMPGSETITDVKDTNTPFEAQKIQKNAVSNILQNDVKNKIVAPSVDPSREVSTLIDGAEGIATNLLYDLDDDVEGFRETVDDLMENIVPELKCMNNSTD